MIRTSELTEATIELLEFINECDRRGYKNNNSLEAMRFNWCLETGGMWYATYDNEKIVGISGVHPFMDGWRALFRGCQLYSEPGGLSKNHMNCWMFKYHLPLVIDRHWPRPIFVTTNTDNDASGKMLKLNRLYFHLANKGIFEHLGEDVVFSVNQNIWELNIDAYEDVRGIY